MPESRNYRFSLTVQVEDDHAAFDDREWITDAAAGALTNEYCLTCVYGEIEHQPQ
jgi:hypothetical protein